MSGGNDEGVSDVTNRTEPWDGAKTYFTGLYSNSLIAFNDTPRTPYPGPFFAQDNAYDVLARTAADAAAGLNFTNGNLLHTHAPKRLAHEERVLGHWEDVLNGDFLVHTSNPYIEDAVTEATTIVEERLTEGVLPKLIDSAIQAGAYGGDAQTLISQLALADFSRTAVEMATRIYYENYGRERQVQSAVPPIGLDIYPLISQLHIDRAKLYAGNADALRILEQLGIDEDLKEFEETLNAPWRGFSEHIGVLTGGGFNTETMTDPSKQKNMIGSVFQGLVGGGMMGLSLAKAAGVAGLSAAAPWMAPFAVLGGLAGALGR